jgi:hypothetical protein
MTDAGISDDAAGQAPPRAGLVLVALILVAAVANLNLSVANVALPDIGRHFDSSQTTLDLIAACCSLGLAGSRARRDPEDPARCDVHVIERPEIDPAHNADRDRPGRVV